MQKKQIFYHHWHIILKLDLSDFFMQQCLEYIINDSEIIPDNNSLCIRFNNTIVEYINKSIVNILNML